YVYLRLMEEQGVEPGYGPLRQAWIDHVDNWVWLANRQTLALMHEGYGPPYTGREGVNADWFQIDPQLVNEIWAITAPGMVGYAAAKSAWAGRVMADGEGLGPTIAYGAMFAAAITEPDVRKLVDIGAAALPEGEKFRLVIADMKALHAKHPKDWKAARAEMAAKYYIAQERRSIWDANLNGACAILALLYGEGDFQRTLDLASAMGFDADNQAATLGGLLGMAQGVAGIPRVFLYPVEGWTEPFNDRYLNRSRRDMPSASIRDMARRTLVQAEKVVLANGGRLEDGPDGPTLVIPIDARFTPPLEIAAEPPRTLERGEPWRWSLYGGGLAPVWSVAAGKLPPGLSLGAGGEVSGVPTKVGRYAATLQASEQGRSVQRDLSWLVVGENLAPAAVEIFAGDVGLAGKLEPLRDGRTVDGVDVVTTPGPVAVETFGYRWLRPVTVAAIVVTMGHMDEASGWFTSLGSERVKVSFDQNR
ncbi:MAG: ADP-ribosylglycohydrolase family protein, partial [Pseudomonadota bacterium]